METGAVLAVSEIEDQGKVKNREREGGGGGV